MPTNEIIREQHHKMTDNIRKQNKRLEREFGNIEGIPRVQWKLTDDIFVDTVFTYTPVETQLPNPEDASNPTKFFVPREDEVRVTIADIQGRVIWTLASFRHPLGNAHERYQQHLAGNGGALLSSQMSYICVPNGELDWFDWPDENMTTCMIYLLRKSLETLPEWVRDTRRRNFEARKKAAEKRADFLRDKLGNGIEQVGFTGAFQIQAKAAAARLQSLQTTGPVVLAT